MKRAVVIGGGLLGALTALRLTQDGIEPVILEAHSELFNNMKPILLGSLQANNGFHGLELPRAEEFHAFLVNEAGLDMHVRMQKRFLLICGNLIDAQAPVHDWPKTLQDILPHEAVTLSGSDWNLDWVSPAYRHVLESVAERYGGMTLGMPHLIPWFFPPNISVISSDEGDAFRHSVRSGRVSPRIAAPISGLFGDVGTAVGDLLRRRGVRTHFDAKLSGNPRSLRAEIAQHIGADKLQIVWAAPATPILASLHPMKLQEIRGTRRTRVLASVEIDDSIIPEDAAEILVLDPDVAELTRVSHIGSSTQPTQSVSEGRQRLLLEFSFDPEVWARCDERQLMEMAASTLESVGRGVELIGFTEMGSTFAVTREWSDEASQLVTDGLEAAGVSVCILPYFAPINMAKVWEESKRLQGLASRM